MIDDEKKHIIEKIKQKYELTDNEIKDIFGTECISDMIMIDDYYKIEKFIIPIIERYKQNKQNKQNFSTYKIDYNIATIDNRTYFEGIINKDVFKKVTDNTKVYNVYEIDNIKRQDKIDLLNIHNYLKRVLFLNNYLKHDIMWTPIIDYSIDFNEKKYIDDKIVIIIKNIIISIEKEFLRRKEALNYSTGLSLEDYNITDKLFSDSKITEDYQKDVENYDGFMDADLFYKIINNDVVLFKDDEKELLINNIKQKYELDDISYSKIIGDDFINDIVRFSKQDKNKADNIIDFVINNYKHNNSIK